MKRILFWLTLFAIAMAYLEAAVVVYLRELYYPENLQVIFPSRLLSDFDLAVELGREAATVIMMLAVARLLGGKIFIRNAAAFVFLFGTWDLFYYIWLKVLLGWPAAWLEWDILFLIPWVWLGPWICPALISLLFIGWGGWILLSERNYPVARQQVLLFLGGALLALIAFLQPALAVLINSGREGFTNYIPDNFWWLAFLPGYLMMAAAMGSVIFNNLRIKTSN